MTSLLTILLLAAAPGSSHAPATPAAESDGPTKGLQASLPNSEKLQEALGVASEALFRERQEMMEERRRLEQLREEIGKESRRLSGDSTETEQLTSDEQAKKEQDRVTKVRHIAKGLAAMSPGAAAVTLVRLTDNQSVELLNVLDGKIVGKILEAMPPDRAAVLMQVMLGRAKTAALPSKESSQP